MILETYVDMMKVYFDNAATTSLRPEVVKHMTDILSDTFGNASSSHSYGKIAPYLMALKEQEERSSGSIQPPIN